jgi:hypothetical protein
MSTGSGKSTTEGKKAEASRRKALVLELRIAGDTYAVIAQKAGVTRQRAHQIVMEEMSALAKQREDSTAKLASMENERLDAMHAVLWPKAMAGDYDAIDRLVRISARRSKLLGLDVPTTMTVGVNKIAAPLQVVIEEVASGTTGTAAADNPVAPCAETVPGIDGTV